MSVRDHASAAEVRPFGDDHVALGVELDAVGHAAGRAEDGRLARLGIELPDVPGLDGHLLLLGDVREGDVAEIDHAVGSDGDAFGQNHSSIEHFFQFRIGRNNRIGCPHRLKRWSDSDGDDRCNKK